MPKWSRSVRGLAAIALTSVATCAYERDPTGVSDGRETGAATQGGLVYAEERRAAELAREIPELAGFFFDTSGNVIVLLKGLAASETMKDRLRPRLGKELSRGRRKDAADLIVRTVDYSFLELKDWRDRLMRADILTAPGVVWLDLDEVRNRVVIGLDVGADPGAARVIAQDLGIPAEAVAFEVTGPYVSQQSLQDQFRPIEGGIRIQRVSGGQRVSCTLGFTALWNNQPVFLTAGHCSPDPAGIDGVAQFQPTAPLTASDSAVMTPIGREIAHFSTPCGNRRCSYSDAAVYGALVGSRLGYIAKTVSGCFRDCPEPILDLDPNRPYWLIDTTHEGFVVNDLVSKIGSATGWSQANVQRTCVNVSPAQGVTAYCQMFANYGADGGDSGAPILLDIGLMEDSTVTLGGIHSGRAGSNSVFSPWSGIVQDYGSLSVLPTQQDTTRPPVPTGPLTLPADSSMTVRRPGGHSDNLYYRNILELVFHDSTSGLTVRAVLSRYEAEIIGGRTFPGITKGGYVIRVPDPGPTFEDLEEMLSRLEAEPGVHFVRAMMFMVRWDFRSRFPNEGPSVRRVNWQDPGAITDGTRSRLAIRAPLAWGCETGTYANERVRVGVLDMVFASEHEDLPAARVLPIFDPTEVNVGLLVDRTLRSHGTAVAGVMAAIGDNGLGITGVLWGADLQLYPYGQGQSSVRDPFERFDDALEDAARRNVRVMVTSLPFGDAASTRDVGRLRESLRQYLSAGSGNLFVLAGGEILGGVGRRMTLQQLQTTTDSGLTPLDRAAAQLMDTFPNQIILVAGTDASNRFWAPSDFYTGGTRIVAPATGILTLADPADFPAGTIVGEGNSFAAPFVAGVAGLLLAADPTLSGAQVTEYILRGAQLPRGNPVTGQEDPAQPVSGAPETVYQLDAYGALQLAARRQGAPLCRNRVWAEGTSVIAERDPSPQARTTEQLAALGEPGILLNVRHGGRRFEVSNGVSDRAFELRQGAWVETSDTATTPHGGTFLSAFGRSHDLDSAAIVEWQAVNDSEVVVRLDIRDFPAGTLTTLKTLVFPTARYPTTACVLLHDGECTGSAPTGTDEDVERIELAYPSLGGRLLLAVTYFTKRDVGFTPWEGCEPNPPHYNSCAFRAVNYQGQTDRTALWGVDLRTGADTSLSELPGVGVFWFGASEEGAERVSGEGVTTAAGTGTSGEVFITGVTGCAVRYRGMASGAEVRPAILTADACATLRRGQGTMAPAPPIVLSP